ncbi:MAG: hypothetical protein RLZZ292_2617 [Bacteroidota bacterium]|jgi:hypothetical protein
MYTIPNQPAVLSGGDGRYRVQTLARTPLASGTYQIAGPNTTNGVIGQPALPNGSWIKNNGDAWTGQYGTW